MDLTQAVLQQVGTPSLLAMAATLVLSVLLPLAVIIVLLVRKKIHVIPVLVGAAVFFVFQMILRIPALQIAAQLSPGFARFIATPIAGGAFLGITAGLFEEFGRYAGYRLLLKRRTAWSDGFAFGLGHGGIESILLIGMSYVNNLLYSVVINTGGWGELAALLPQGTADQIFAALTGTPPYSFLLAGVERVFAITIQVAFSLLVLYGVRTKRFRYVLLAVALHLLVDGPIALLSTHFTIWGAELYVALCAAAALVFILRSRAMFERLERPADQ